MATYYKEITVKNDFLILRENNITNAKFGYIVNNEKNIVYFYGLYKTWERSFDLKYYKSRKGNYINFHGRRLYFDIQEREEKRLVKVEIEGGREI